MATARQQILNTAKEHDVTVHSLEYTRNNFGDGWFMVATVSDIDRDFEGVTADDIISHIKVVCA